MPESADAAGGRIKARAPRQAAFLFVFVTVVLDMFALGVIMPVLPKLVTDFLAGDTARAAEIFGLFGTAWALMQFLFSPLQGVLSDRYGRRALILLSNVGLGLDYILMALAPNLAWLFVGRILSGICAASISTAYAYIADVTPPEERSARFGMLGAAFGLGFVLGPAIGGVAGNVDPRLPFWIAGALSLANALYGALVLPESLPPERRMAFSWRRANPVGSVALLRSSPQLLGLAVVSFLGNFAHNVLPSMTVLYTTYRYGWDEMMVGFNLAFVGLCAIVVQGGLIKPFVTRFGDRTALIVGLLFGTSGFLVFAFAPNGAIFWAGVPLIALWGLAGASTLGLMSQAVGPTQQGQIQGANASIQGVASMAAPVVFTQVFALFIGQAAALHLPGAPYVLAALCLVASAAVGWRVTRPAV